MVGLSVSALMTMLLRFTSFARLTLAGAFYSLTLSGCLSPITLNRAVTAYDEAVTDAISKQLLINIARAHRHQPIHFTGVSNIAATFDFRVNAGATPALTGDTGMTLVPTFGGSVAENPTISIVPIEGEEFTKRLLTPFQETKFVLLLRQRFDIDLMLRLMMQELRIKQDGREVAFRNTPSDKQGYEMFRRVVTHLSAIQDQNQLYAEPLISHRTWTIPANSVSAEGFQSLQNEYLLTYNQKDATYTLQKPIVGRVLITNYDPDTLSPEEREQLIYETQNGHVSDVSFDIRPGHFGGEYPLRGNFRLRSFNTILSALGRGLEEEREYHVEKDPRTMPVEENPVHTIELVMSDSAPSDADMSVKFHGKHYAVDTTGPLTRWNRKGFQLLYFLFQMTVSEVPRVGVPSITIAK
ncbi:conserved exported hypothetical protein [Nitrospira lenta]|uniref:Uncharacterized protein n=2 Tax=Nitrospira lenta TaxID=1436998 RepID=A0A330L1A5_9BACT|nr:conserved exported hypothetical protein [Nitrospira lenta]